MSLIVGIGSEREQYLPSLVLKFTILKNAQRELDIRTLDNAINTSSYKTAMQSRSGKTPFSLQRFLLAELLLSSNHEQAIYLDSDMLVFDDVTKLCLEFQKSGNDLATVKVDPIWNRKPQSSVLLMNRNGAKLLLERFVDYLENNISYDDLMYFENISGWASIGHTWNCLEYYDQNTQLLHFTDMDTQPWLKTTNKFCGIWEIALLNLLDEPEVKTEFFRSIEKGFVRPSLRQLPTTPYRHYSNFNLLLKDYFWVPPHRYKRIKNPAIRKLIAPLYHINWHIKIYRNSGLVNRV